MPYGPHTADDRERMLAALGLKDVDELFADIPADLRASRLDLPEPEPELELAARLQSLAARNRTDLASFLGAGVYRHWTPAAVDQILIRGEWYTAYTPYQPEISQGTLQSIYEYESLIAELMDLDVVSASHYDGAAATAEGALMACRATRRQRVLVSRAVHPHYRQTLLAYFGAGLELDEIPVVASGDAAGTTDLAALERLLADSERPVAGVVAGQPNFFGLLEPMQEIGELAHAAGALFVAVVEPVSLAVLAPPGAYGADIAAGEGQPLGIAPQYGGPYLGLLASTDALVRQIPGRLVGMTQDVDGKRAYVMTLRAREQDIRRDKAASNICTNQALLALAASVYLATIGPHGLRDVAALGAARAAELEGALASVGAERLHPGPYLNEFAIRVPQARDVHRRLLDRGVLAGLALADVEPEDETLSDALLVCATEVTTSDEIARFASALDSVLGGRPPVGVEAGAGADRRSPAARPVAAGRSEAAR
ncbi:MAG TPA: aminomethyl-transferring glycine dehydrogenase subunit GcvPA [Candidatus Limnocylindrales bacterium]|jgi:glycine dehydrogenase subunit 1|nr:aminomethyl-transferring glycine dehydrogenase subunit GcvPA [Candidatus Limnocylindrales bacterium]